VVANIDGERPSVDFLAIEGVNGGFCLLTAVHLDEAETFWASRVPVHDDHQAAVEELLRVAREVGIFSLLTLERKPSPHVGPIRTHVAGRGWRAEIAVVCPNHDPLLIGQPQEVPRLLCSSGVKPWGTILSTTGISLLHKRKGGKGHTASDGSILKEEVSDFNGANLGFFHIGHELRPNTSTLANEHSFLRIFRRAFEIDCVVNPKFNGVIHGEVLQPLLDGRSGQSISVDLH